MKKILSFILALLIALSSVPALADDSQMRGVWFSYEDYSSQLANLDMESYKAQADKICKNIKSSGFNTLIFHVRAFSDAFYNSSYFGYSKYVCGTAGVALGYDPLAVMCEIAEKNGLDIHAWINPYRIGSPQNVTESSVAYVWRNTYGDERVCDVNGLWYYNPASEDVREYIAEGVREIVENYPVDGIHFDDYFYPTADESFDVISYQASGTSLSLNDWRIENVNLLIGKTYDIIKRTNPNALFGISPNADIDKNYSQYFADVKKWCSEKGYVDYIVPQIYFGYQNSTMPFSKVLHQWSDICTVPDLYIGLATYKSGKEDKWAGEGKNEWIEHSDICSRQIQEIRNCVPCKGFMVFCYTPVFGETATENAKTELKNMRAILTLPKQDKVFEHFINMIKSLLNI